MFEDELKLADTLAILSVLLSKYRSVVL